MMRAWMILAISSRGNELPKGMRMVLLLMEYPLSSWLKASSTAPFNA